MKKITIFLIFLIALCVGVIIEGVSSGWLLARNSSVVYAPRYIADVDYSTITVVTDEIININTASVSELSLLKGISQGYAKRIIKYRETSGRFEVIEDIMKVPGIGEKKFMEIKDKIKVE